MAATVKNGTPVSQVKPALISVFFSFQSVLVYRFGLIDG